jgi:hypothetical protein
MEIPATVKALLWEYSLDDAPFDERWFSTIMERVMQRGCWDDMRWLLGEFSPEQLRSYLERRGRRTLAPRELRFWSRICGVPDDQQDLWVRESRIRAQAWR